MTSVHALLVLLPPFLLGTGLLAALGIGRRTAPLAWVGWSWAAGALASGAVLFAWSLARLSWSAAGLTAALLVPAAALHGWAARRDARGGPGDTGRATLPRTDARFAAAPRWERLLFGGLVALVLLSALDRSVLAWSEPVWSGDASQIWAAKAKLLWHSGGFVPDFGSRVVTSLAVSHPEYPPLNPLLQLWTYVLAGEVDLFWSRVPLQASAVATLLVLADGLRRLARPLVAGPLLLLYAAVPGSPELDLLPSAMADGLVALSLVIALDAWLRFAAGGERAWLRLLGLGLALGTASKNEGLMTAVLVLAAAVPALATGRSMEHGAPPLARRVGRSLRDLAVPGLVALAPALSTSLVNARFGFRGDLTSGANAAGRPPWELLPEQVGERAPAVLSFLLDQVLLSPRHTRLLFLAALLLAALAPRRSLGGTLRLPAVVLLGAAAVYFLVFVASPNELDWHLRTAGVRVYSQLLGGTALWLAAALQRGLEPHGRWEPA